MIGAMPSLKRPPLMRDPEGSADMVPLTVEQYHRMIETGVLQEGAPIELIDGFLVRKDRSKAGEDPMTVGNEHSWVIDCLMDLAPAIARAGGRVRVQQPVTLSTGEPEPDVSIVRGPGEQYRTRHPAAADVTCVVEVSDSSLPYDRTTKQRIYADHAIPQYVIVNLVERVIEDHHDPKPGTGRYDRREVLARGQELRLSVGAGSVEIPVEALLP